MSRLAYLAVIILFCRFGQKTGDTISYLPLGDSYTICTGAQKEESWPVLLSAHLNDSGVALKLLDNPARNGYSTQDLIEDELPLLKKYKPGFVTLLIGVNDWVRNVDKSTYSKNLDYILDEVQASLKRKKNILLITIPDFGVTPEGKKYGGGRNISAGIADFNSVIVQKGKERGLAVCDLFAVSKGMAADRNLVAADGLHPSAKEYALWEKLIFKESLKILKNKKADR